MTVAPVRKGLLLAGGHGTRLRPLTFRGNKHLLPIANTPMLFYGLRHLREAGVEEVGIILGPIKEGIEEAVGDGAAFGLRVTYVTQGEPKGLAHAVRCAQPFLGQEPFLMYLGDNLLEHGARPYLERYQQGDARAVIGVVEVADPRPYGVVELGPTGEILSLEEKPQEPRSHLALVGVYLFPPEIHEVIRELRPSPRGELEITDAIRVFHARTRGVRALRLEGWWKDTGHPSDLLEANARILNGRPPSEFRIRGTVDPHAQIRGPVEVGEGSRIGPGTILEGPLILGRDVEVAQGAYVGPFTSVGDGSVLRRAHLQRCIVMEQVTIEAPVRLQDSIIGKGSHLTERDAKSEAGSYLLGDMSRVVL